MRKEVVDIVGRRRRGVGQARYFGVLDVVTGEADGRCYIVMSGWTLEQYSIFNSIMFKYAKAFTDVKNGG